MPMYKLFARRVLDLGTGARAGTAWPGKGRSIFLRPTGKTHKVQGGFPNIWINNICLQGSFPDTCCDLVAFRSSVLAWEMQAIIWRLPGFWLQLHHVYENRMFMLSCCVWRLDGRACRRGGGSGARGGPRGGPT